MLNLMKDYNTTVGSRKLPQSSHAIRRASQSNNILMGKGEKSPDGALNGNVSTSAVRINLKKRHEAMIKKAMQVKSASAMR